MLKEQEELRAWKEQQESFQQEQQSKTQLQQYLDSLHEEHGEFNDLFVTGLLAAGVDGADAVNQFKDMIRAAGGNPDAPVSPPVQQENGSGSQAGTPPPKVMGGSGATGSGLPTQPVKFGSMSTTDLNKLVSDLIQNAE